MNPRETALELVGKFSDLVTTWDCYDDSPIPDDEILKDTKKCALISVDVILKELLECGEVSILSRIKYWEEVKAEIEKLGNF